MSPHVGARLRNGKKKKKVCREFAWIRDFFLWLSAVRDKEIAQTRVNKNRGNLTCGDTGADESRKISETRVETRTGKETKVLINPSCLLILEIADSHGRHDEYCMVECFPDLPL